MFDADIVTFYRMFIFFFFSLSLSFSLLQELTYLKDVPNQNAAFMHILKSASEGDDPHTASKKLHAEVKRLKEREEKVNEKENTPPTQS